MALYKEQTIDNDGSLKLQLGQLCRHPNLQESPGESCQQKNRTTERSKFMEGVIYVTEMRKRSSNHATLMESVNSSRDESVSISGDAVEDYSSMQCGPQISLASFRLI